ncbi:hypothetical protein FB451DRAFT_1222407, partial [Mycena latifolia]
MLLQTLISRMHSGQFPSLTSGNNFINFCGKTLPGTSLTNGQQITTGIPRTRLFPATDKMPSSKFQNPKNLDTIPVNTPFNISLALNNLDLRPTDLDFFPITNLRFFNLSWPFYQREGTSFCWADHSANYMPRKTTTRYPGPRECLRNNP